VIPEKEAPGGSAALFLQRARYYLNTEYRSKLRLAVEALPPDRLWWRPNEKSNSTGNLLLHLAGNIRQWIVRGVGGAPGTRDRAQEFAALNGPPAAELLAELERALDEVDETLSRVSPEQLLERRNIQGRDVTVFEAILHVVEHFSMHVGQIVLIAKWHAPGAVQFYEDAGGLARPLWPTLAQKETLEEKIGRLVQEDVAIVPYDARWPQRFRLEEAHLRSCLPMDLIRRIEHFGSTSVPGLAAKPIVDMLVEVSDMAAARTRIAPVLESQGYDYLWRPTKGDDGPPFYAFFIKRDPVSGDRTHHIHMVTADFETHWDRLRFRDFLIANPDVARRYEALKRQLASNHPKDRVAYTFEKGKFIEEVMARARQGSATR